MKRFAIRVVLHILLIVLLSIGSYLLFQKQLWFSTTICMILLIITAVHLYRMQFKQIALLRRLTDGLRYNDMMQTFHPPFKNKIMNEWAEELSDTLKDFRGKLLAEPMHSFAKKLDKEIFAEVYHCIYVNVDYVCRVDADSLLLDNGVVIPVSRRKRKEVMTAVMKRLVTR